MSVLRQDPCSKQLNQCGRRRDRRGHPMSAILGHRKSASRLEIEESSRFTDRPRTTAPILCRTSRGIGCQSIIDVDLVGQSDLDDKLHRLANVCWMPLSYQACDDAARRNRRPSSIHLRPSRLERGVRSLQHLPSALSADALVESLLFRSSTNGTAALVNGRS